MAKTSSTGAVAADMSPRFREQLTNCLWSLASIALFAGFWELAWYFGLADETALPPPHVFLSNFPDQAKNFEAAILVGTRSLGPWFDVLTVMMATVLRVIAGLALGFVGGILVGTAIRYFSLFGTIVLPTVTMLAPISPIAWLPVAIFMLGVGNAPAIFMVFIAIFFMITLSTLSQIDRVDVNIKNAAKIMGASKRQMYWNVILPAVLPGLFVILRLNLFGAWMVVLVAEAAGVGSGLGQIINLARNTYNFTLVLFTMTLIGVLGFVFDLILRKIQSRVLFWIPQTTRSLAR